MLFVNICRLITVCALAAVPTGLSSQSAAQPPARSDSTVGSYAPHRVFDARRNQFTDFEAMLGEVKSADVLFLGEQHDDPITHRLELATLEGLARRRANIVLVMEMFERDAQRPLSDYLSGLLPEADFLKASRPWPRYATDYRPMVEWAKARGWPVIAGNVPRRLASFVSRAGLGGLDTLSPGDRLLIATNLSCPRDAYFDRFAKTMGDMSGHGAPGAPTPTEQQKQASLERIYQSQCVKDETMGEAIASALEQAPSGALVVHVNGSFHSDFRMGTAARAQSRLKSKRVAVVSFVPVADLDKPTADGLRDLGDYVVFTLAPPTTPAKP